MTSTDYRQLTQAIALLENAPFSLLLQSDKLRSIASRIVHRDELTALGKRVAHACGTAFRVRSEMICTPSQGRSASIRNIGAIADARRAMAYILDVEYARSRVETAIVMGNRTDDIVAKWRQQARKRMATSPAFKSAVDEARLILRIPDWRNAA